MKIKNKLNGVQPPRGLFLYFPSPEAVIPKANLEQYNWTLTAIKRGMARYCRLFCLILLIMSSKRQIGRPRVFHSQNHGHITTEDDLPAVLMKFWYRYKLTYHKFEKRWADVFQIYPNAIRFNASPVSPISLRSLTNIYDCGRPPKPEAITRVTHSQRAFNLW